MARAFAKAFYNSQEWIRLAKAYREKHFFTCERCGAANAREVHHNFSLCCWSTPTERKAQMELDKIYQGDCIAGMRQLADESVDLIVTDPPYLMNYKSGRRKDKGHRFNRPIEGDKEFQLIHDYILECYRVLKPNSAAYVFCNQNHVDYFMQEARAAGFNIKNLIVWDKMNHTVGDLQASFGRRYEFVLLLNKGRCFFNGHRLEDIWQYKPVRRKQQQHQNQKPLELIIRCDATLSAGKSTQDTTK